MLKRSRRGIRGEGGFKVLLSVTAFLVVAYALFKIVPLHIEGNELEDALMEGAKFGNLKPPEIIKYEIWKKAQDNAIPIALTDIKFERRGQVIIISTRYEKKVDILGYEYVYSFDKSKEATAF